MKGATAFASILFCVCAVLAVAYVKGRAPIVAIAGEKGKAGITKENLDAQSSRLSKRHVPRWK